MKIDDRIVVTTANPAPTARGVLSLLGVRGVIQADVRRDGTYLVELEGHGGDWYFREDDLRLISPLELLAEEAE